MHRLQRAPRVQSVLRTHIARQTRRSISRWSKPDENAHYQPVRIVTPLFHARRLATFALYTGCIGGYLYWLSPEVVLEVEEVETDQQGRPVKSEQEGQDEEFAEADSRFIPMTWASPLPVEYYKGSDPEWQEFRKVATDQPRQKRIYGDLVSVVQEGVKQHKGLARALGQNVKVGKVWLDVQFPDKPPQDYSRKGIEIGEDFIAWSEQRITKQEYERTTRALYPTALASSLYAYCRVMWTFQVQKFRSSFGLNTDAKPGTHEHAANHLLEQLQAQQASQDSRSRLGKTQTDPQSDVQERTQAGNSSGSGVSDSDKKWSLPLPSVRPGLPGGESEQTIATAMFVHTLHQNWKSDSKEPPRGTFIVQGLIQMLGAEAQITLDVSAFYDPKISRFVKVNVAPRLVKRWKQSPKGGQ